MGPGRRHEPDTGAESKEREQADQPYWQQDLAVGEGRFLGEPYTIRLKVCTIMVQDRLRPTLNVDNSPDGTVSGIELLNANQQLGGDREALVIVDEALGR